MAWRWTAQRLAISAFVLFHLSAIDLDHARLRHQGTIPGALSVLHVATGTLAMVVDVRTQPPARKRLLEAEVVDAKKLIHIYEFTKIGDLSAWQKFGRYRNPKFTDNIVAGGEYCQGSANSRLAMWFASWAWGKTRFL